MTAAASKNAYDSVDAMTGGNVSSSLNLATEVAKSGWASMASYGSSWLSAATSYVA
jgi:hypothetical protein